MLRKILAWISTYPFAAKVLGEFKETADQTTAYIDYISDYCRESHKEHRDALERWVEEWQHAVKRKERDFKTEEAQRAFQILAGAALALCTFPVSLFMTKSRGVGGQIQEAATIATERQREEEARHTVNFNPRIQNPKSKTLNPKP
jgi:hypothetical protein